MGILFNKIDLEDLLKSKAIKNIADEFNVSTSTIYYYVSKYKLNHVRPEIYKVCEQCLQQYKASTVHGVAFRQKYCSDNCRDAAFKVRNPNKYSEYNKRCRLKKPLLCREYKNPIDNDKRKCGLVFCSDNCKSIRKKRTDKEWYDKNAIAFRQYKESLGCSKCGYNKYGGSLDFHHIDPEEKEIRIEQRHWKSQSDKILKELEKCILLCKNCHYEEHAKMRLNTNGDA